MPALRRRAAGATNDRFSGVYVHSNPPRVFKSPNMRDPASTGLGFKKSNIRIWIHNINLKNLQQVVWEGCGSQLLVEHSNNPKVKRFLETIPHMMGLIKDIHVDVQNDDLDSLKSHVSSPVPPVVLSGKDQNGLTALHKAAGLGRQEIAEFIVGKLPDTVNAVDNEGRTPLHYSALLKDNSRMFEFLLQNGASESALDNRQKAAAYYKTRHSEIDAKILNVVPECPRSGKSEAIDWNVIDPSLPSLNGNFKGSEGNLTERSIKDAKESQKRLKRSQNLAEETREEEINNNKIKKAEPTGKMTNADSPRKEVSNGNTIQDNDKDESPAIENGDNEEHSPDKEEADSKEDADEESATNKNAPIANSIDNEEKISETENQTDENDKEDLGDVQAEEIANTNEDDGQKDNGEPENAGIESHNDNPNESSTVDNGTDDPDEERATSRNEETTATEGSGTRPTSKTSRQNSSAKSETKSKSRSSFEKKDEENAEGSEGVIEGELKV